MLFTCENCKDQEKNFSSIRRDILQNARERGWGEDFLFKCFDVKCHHHQDNLDSARLALGIYQPERSKREDSQKCEMRCSEHCGNTVRDK